MAADERARPGDNRAGGRAARSESTVRRDDIPTPPDTCPACGLDYERGFVNGRGDLLTAYYACKLGHLWSKQWAIIDVFGDAS